MFQWPGKKDGSETERPVYRDPNDLSGQVAVISGSTSGIGLALARAVASRGGDVVLNGLGDPSEIERTRAEMEASCGVRVRYHAADMTKGDEVADMVAFAKHQLGRLDVLVNNAGVGRGAAVAETTQADLDLQLAVNLRTPILLYREAIGLLRAGAREHQGALVVNVASITGVYGEPWLSVYAATKAGLINWTESMHRELSAEGVKSTALCPGFVDTPSRDPAAGAPDPTAMMTPDDIAEAVRFLLRVSPACCVPRMELVRPGERMA